MTFLVAILIAGLVFAGYMGFDKMMAQRELRELTRKRIFEDPTGNGTISLDSNALFGLNNEKSPSAQLIEKLLRGLGVRVDEAEQKLGRRLLHAGIGSPNAVIYTLAFQRFVAPILLIIGIVMILRNDAQGTSWLLNVMIGLVIVVIGIFGAKLYIDNATAKRKKILQHSFPDALDLMLVCVESGLALDSSLSRVCNELGRVHPLITGELNRTRIELSLLNNRTQALQNLAERTDLVAFRFFVAALIQSEKFGTSLSETLRVMADEYRQKRMLLAEEKAARLPVLMTIPLIFCLMPAFLLIILGPAVIGFMSSGFFDK